MIWKIKYKCDVVPPGNHLRVPGSIQVITFFASLVYLIIKRVLLYICYNIIKIKIRSSSNQL